MRNIALNRDEIRQKGVRAFKPTKKIHEKMSHKLLFSSDNELSEIQTK